MEGAGQGMVYAAGSCGCDKCPHISWDGSLSSFLDWASGLAGVCGDEKGNFISIIREVSLGESERSLRGGSLDGSGEISGSRADHLSHLAGTRISSLAGLAGVS